MGSCEAHTVTAGITVAVVVSLEILIRFSSPVTVKKIESENVRHEFTDSPLDSIVDDNTVTGEQLGEKLVSRPAFTHF